MKADRHHLAAIGNRRDRAMHRAHVVFVVGLVVGVVSLCIACSRPAEGTPTSEALASSATPTSLPTTPVPTHPPSPLAEATSGTETPSSTVRATAEPEHTIIERWPGNSYVRFLEWGPTNASLTYALGPGFAEELRDWNWTFYQLPTATRLSLPSPASRISDSVRLQLGLCVSPTIDCWHYSDLYVSPSGAWLAYGPYGARGWERDSENLGELWVANADGSASRLVSDNLPGSVEWNVQEDFLLVDHGWSEWPLAWLVKLSDLSHHSILELTGIEDCELHHAAPHFSPDGRRVFFVGGRREGEELQCSLWQYDVDTRETAPVSAHAGAISWSPDGLRLYILERRYVGQDRQVFDLYRIVQDGTVSTESLIAEELPFNAYLNSNLKWSVSPDECLIAYTDAFEPGTLSILELAPYAPTPSAPNRE